MTELTDEQKFEKVNEIKAILIGLPYGDAVRIAFTAALEVFGEMCEAVGTPVQIAHHNAHGIICSWFASLEDDNGDDGDDLDTPPDGVTYSGNA